MRSTVCSPLSIATADEIARLLASRVVRCGSISFFQPIVRCPCTKHVCRSYRMQNAQGPNLYSRGIYIPTYIDMCKRPSQIPAPTTRHALYFWHLQCGTMNQPSQHTRHDNSYFLGSTRYYYVTMCRRKHGKSQLIQDWLPTVKHVAAQTSCRQHLDPLANQR